MSATKPPSGLEGFKVLSDLIFVYEPPNSESNGQVTELKMTPSITPSPPTTIMLFAWADGQPKHVAKYVSFYKTLYPSARIIVILSKSSMIMLSTYESTQKAMRPAVDALAASPLPGGIKDERVLVEIFSNGGGVNLQSACHCYRSTFGSVLPHSLLIQDSSPGGDKLAAELPRWTNAITTGVAPHLPLPRWLVSGVVMAWCAVMIGVPTMFGVENVATVCRRSVNDPEMLEQEAGRLYVYSEADVMVGWEAVEQHAAEAKRKGWSVRMEKMKDSPHVAHLKFHPEEYKEAVTSSWNEAMKRTG